MSIKLYVDSSAKVLNTYIKFLFLLTIYYLCHYCDSEFIGKKTIRHTGI